MPTGMVGIQEALSIASMRTRVNFTGCCAKDTSDQVRSFVGVLSPDDKTFYLVARARSQPLWTRIVGIEVATGIERPVVTFPGSGLTTPPALAISPDGSMLALRTEDGRIRAVRIDGNEYRELKGSFPGFANPYGPTAAGSPAVLQWTPDGKSIVFVASTAASPAGWRLMKVSASGGLAEFDGLDSSRVDSAVSLPRQGVGNVYSVDVNASGSHITFSSFVDRTYVVWKLSNVMSALASGRQQ